MTKILCYFLEEIWVRPFLRSMHSSSSRDSETLSLRVERHVQNALKVVQYLKPASAGREGTSSVCQPRIRRSRRCTRSTSRTAAAPSSPLRSRATQRPRQKFIDNLELFSLLANVADVKSLADLHTGDHDPQPVHRGGGTGGHPSEHDPVCPSVRKMWVDIIEDLDEAFRAIAECSPEFCFHCEYPL